MQQNVHSTFNSSDSDIEILDDIPDMNPRDPPTVSAPLPLTLFMNQLCPGKVENILTSDVLSNKSSMAVLVPISEAAVETRHYFLWLIIESG